MVQGISSLAVLASTNEDSPIEAISHRKLALRKYSRLAGPLARDLNIEDPYFKVVVLIQAKSKFKWS